MPRSFRCRTAARANSLLLVLAALGGSAAFADEPPIVVKRQTRTGQEVLVRGFAQFDANCNLVRVQTISVAAAPRSGSVETRPGPVVVGRNWIGETRCEGTTLQGVNVFYVPAPGFTGTDRFSLDVVYSARRIVRAEVEVAVR